MSKILYIEDIFCHFFYLIENGGISVQHQDVSPITSFYNKINSKEQLTSNQGSYLIKLLEKYKKLSMLAGFDYSSYLLDATWKENFRVLDLSKKIYVEKTSKGVLEVVCKFPYQLKTEFDKEIELYTSNNPKISYWDHENKVRRLSLNDVNLINIYEFACRHSFDIDESFMCALADIEEIWQNEENIRPTCIRTNNFLHFKNIAPIVSQFLESRITGNISNDLFLAKSMGIRYTGPCEVLSEKIAASIHNTFWLKDIYDFFKLYNSITGTVAVILDRSADTLQWLKDFVKKAEECSVNRDDIRVCFRDNKDSDTGLNEWIKLAGVGGKIESGRIFIFEHKPAKWLFKENIDVKIVLTNNLYPHTNQITKDWLDSHPCVIYLGDIKPSEQRGKKIVEL